MSRGAAVALFAVGALVGLDLVFRAGLEPGGAYLVGFVTAIVARLCGQVVMGEDDEDEEEE